MGLSHMQPASRLRKPGSGRVSHTLFCCLSRSRLTRRARFRYVKDILANTPAQQDQVTIEPDGRWHAPGLEGETIETSRESHDDASYIDDDDDALIISDISFVGVDRSCVTPGQAAPGMGTPTTIGSYGSHSIPRASSSSGKRPISQVIDLTLSDDDEPPDPAPKRQNFGPPSTYMNMARSRPA